MVIPIGYEGHIQTLMQVNISVSIVNNNYYMYFLINLLFNCNNNYRLIVLVVTLIMIAQVNK